MGTRASAVAGRRSAAGGVVSLGGRNASAASRDLVPHRGAPQAPMARLTSREKRRHFDVEHRQHRRALPSVVQLDHKPGPTECRVETLTLSLWEDGKAMRCSACGRRLRCGACGAVPAVRYGAVRHAGAPRGGHILGERPSCPTRPTDESHLPLAEMYTSRSMSRLLHEHAFHDHVSQTYI